MAKTEVTDITVAAKGHSYDENFVCTICNYVDKRFGMIELCDGVKITSFEDNEYPWQLIDLSADGMTNFGLELPSDCKGIMSSNYHVSGSSSEFTINFKVDKLVKLTFDCAISSESGYDDLSVYLDGRSSNVICSGIEKNTGNVFLSSGNHSVRFVYQKDNSMDNGADRVLVYNIKISQQFESYGSVRDGDTRTFRKFSDGESLSNVTLLDDINTFRSLVSSSSIKNVVFEPSFKGYEPNSLYRLFYENTGLKTITELENLNTSKVTDMSYMFYGCWSLGEFDIEKLNTSSVTNMSYMFYNCSSPSSLDLSGFDTRNVTNMSHMFDACYSFKSIKFGDNFDTSKVTNMYYMFNDCCSLEALDLTGFNTSNVTDMGGMFRLKRFEQALKHIYVSDKFTTDKVSSSSSMFDGCTDLRNFDASSIDKTHANYGSDGYLEACYKIGDVYTPLTGDELKVTTLDLKDGSDFMASVPFTAETASYSRSLANGTMWNTLCLPFEVSLTGQNFRAFKLLSASDDVVVLEEIETSIAAGQPVLINMNEGATALDITAQDKSIVTKVEEGSSTDDGGLQLVGIYTKKMFSKDTDNNCYIVKGNKLMNLAKILENTTTATVGSKGFRAYMKEAAQQSQPAKAYRLSTDKQETAIDMLEGASDVATEYYDLQGNRLNEPQKGVNIIKRAGKTMKVIIR